MPAQAIREPAKAFIQACPEAANSAGMVWIAYLARLQSLPTLRSFNGFLERTGIGSNSISIIRTRSLPKSSPAWSMRPTRISTPFAPTVTSC